MSIPYLQALGGLLLLPIAIKLLAPAKEGHVEEADNFAGAVKTIIVADAAEVTLTKLDSTEVTAHAGNILVGSDAEIAQPAGNVYVLGIVESTLGFYKYTGSAIPAGKAYYVVSE